jgi:ketosteroid isomerase-like protein
VPARLHLVAEDDRIRLVKRAFEAFGSRDLDTLVELSDPAIEISSVTGVIAGREEPYTGVSALADYLGDVERIWDQIELVPQEFHEMENGERILVFGRVRARRGKSRVDTPNAWLWELRGGKVVGVRVYAEPNKDARWLFK